MKMIVAGSRSLPAGSASFAFPVLDALEEGDSVLLRKPKNADPSHFENIIAAYCRYRDVPYTFFEPQPTEEFPGRASVYVRDVDMAKEADRALIFLLYTDAVAGNSGTYHLMEKAIDAGGIVDAFSVGYEGMRLVAERIGST